MSAQSEQPAPANKATATFAGGCFWCVEADFEKKWTYHVLGFRGKEGWQTIPARVNGDLPAADIEATTATGRNVAVVHIFAGTKFEMQTTGNATFTLPKGMKAEAWLDGKSLGRANQFTAKVAAGKHRIVLRLDAKALPKVLRLESKDVAFLND